MDKAPTTCLPFFTAQELHARVSACWLGIFPGVSQTFQTPCARDRDGFSIIPGLPPAEDGTATPGQVRSGQVRPGVPLDSSLSLTLLSSSSARPLSSTAFPKPTSYHLNPTHFSPFARTTAVISFLVFLSLHFPSCCPFSMRRPEWSL